MLYIIRSGEKNAVVPHSHFPEHLAEVSAADKKIFRKMKKLVKKHGRGYYCCREEKLAESAAKMGLREADPVPLMQKLAFECAMKALEELYLRPQECWVAVYARRDTPAVSAAAEALGRHTAGVVPVIGGGGDTVRKLKDSCGIAAFSGECTPLVRRCSLSLYFSPVTEPTEPSVMLNDKCANISAAISVKGEKVILPIQAAAYLVRQRVLLPEELSIENVLRDLFLN